MATVSFIHGIQVNNAFSVEKGGSDLAFTTGDRVNKEEVCITYTAWCDVMPLTTTISRNISPQAGGALVALESIFDLRFAAQHARAAIAIEHPVRSRWTPTGTRDTAKGCRLTSVQFYLQTMSMFRLHAYRILISARRTPK